MDMVKLKRKSAAFVWVSSFLCFFGSMMPGLLLTTRQGWPKTKYSKLPPWVIFATVGSNFALANVPDYFSIAIYIKMWRHYKSISVHPDIVGQEDHPQDAEPYGGIWVGDPDYQNFDDPDAVVPFHMIDMNDPPPPEPHPPSAEPNPVQNHQASDEKEMSIVCCKSGSKNIYNLS